MTTNGKDKVLMGLYGHINFDGRVQRSIDTFDQSQFDLTLLCWKANKEYNIEGVKIETIDKDKVNKFLFYFIFGIKLVLRAISLKPQIIYVHDYYLTYWGAMAKRFTGAKLVYDAHELLVPSESGKQPKREKFYYNLERKTINKVDLIIAANEKRAEIMKSHFGLKKMPIVIHNIPNMVKFSKVEKVNKTEKVKEILSVNLAGRKILVYQGAMTLSRGVGNFILAMKYLKEDGILLLVGGGPDLDKIKNIVSEEGLEENVFILGRMSIEKLYSILNICEYGIITYSMKGLNNYYCAPNKLYEYSNFDITILSSCQPSLLSVYEEYGIGYGVGCSNTTPEGYAEDIKSIFQEPMVIKEKFEYFLSKNNWRLEKAKIDKELKALV